MSNTTPSGPGWYDDPEDSSLLRYFDGVVWSQRTETKAPRPRPEPAPQTPPAQPYAAGLPYQPPGAQPGWSSAPGQQAPGPQAPGPQGQSPSPPGQAPGPTWGGGPAYPQASWMTGPTTPDGVPLASYAQRLGAFVLDWVIQSVLGLLFGGYFLLRSMSGYLASVDEAMAGAESGATPDFGSLMESAQQVDVGQFAIYTLVTVAVFALYQYLFLVRAGQTPGKMLVGISVRSVDRAGPPSSATVLRRLALPLALFLAQVVPLLSFLGLIGRALDLLWPAWDQRRQALHDRAAGTVVVVGRQERVTRAR